MTKWRDKNVVRTQLSESAHDVNNTVKSVNKGHSKIDKTKILMTNGSLMKVKSIAIATLGAFLNTFDLH